MDEVHHRRTGEQMRELDDSSALSLENFGVSDQVRNKWDCRGLISDFGCTCRGIILSFFLFVENYLALET